MAEKTYYRDNLLPKAGETGQAFFERLAAVKPADAKDRAMIAASKAVAVAWKGLEGMANPFTAVAMDDPSSPRENLETAVVLMADAIKGEVRKLDQLKDPKEEIQAAIGKHGSHLPAAARKTVEATVKNQVIGAHDRAVKGVLAAVKGPFDALLEMKDEMPEASPEKAVADELAGAYKEFKEARSKLYDNDDKSKRRR